MRWLRITVEKCAEWQIEGFIPNIAFRVGAISDGGRNANAPPSSMARHWQRADGQVKNLAASSADGGDAPARSAWTVETTI